ncbi:MAG: response regulator [Candidatus Eisenbacteria bacterium]|nr:response regulator [Candidatus Eisenbacteria bacterium]
MTPSDHLRSILPDGARALIVDDSAATRRILRSHLESLGVQVAEAADGGEAYRKLEEKIAETDLIFSDISMPVLDGFELCERLRDASWYDGTPIVMVSTQSDAASVIRAFKLGADDYIPKPFEKDLLAQVIGRVLSHD